MHGDNSKVLPDGEYDPKGHVYEFLGDAYLATETDDIQPIDMRSAGLNAMGEFVIVGHDGQIVRIRDDERIKLAAYLMSPFIEGLAPVMFGGAADVIRKKLNERWVPEEMRIKETKKKQVRGSTKGGIVAYK